MTDLPKRNLDLSEPTIWQFDTSGVHVTPPESEALVT